MEGFRRSYQLPKIWGLVKERMIAFALVILAGIPLTFATILVAFGSRIETRILFHLGHEFGPYILLLWTAVRWLIAGLTSTDLLILDEFGYLTLDPKVGPVLYEIIADRYIVERRMRLRCRGKSVEGRSHEPDRL